MDVLSDYAPRFLKKITFYHLRKKDYKMMYQRAVQLDLEEEINIK